MKLIANCLAVLAFWSTSSAGAASFDCAKAATRIENTICSSSRLSELDDRLSEIYSTVLLQNSDPDGVKSAQRSWLTRARNTCQDEACLVDVYRQRIAALKASLPKEVREVIEHASEEDAADIASQKTASAPVAPPAPAAPSAPVVLADSAVPATVMAASAPMTAVAAKDAEIQVKPQPEAAGTGSATCKAPAIGVAGWVTKIGFGMASLTLVIGILAAVFSSQRKQAFGIAMSALLALSLLSPPKIETLADAQKALACAEFQWEDKTGLQISAPVQVTRITFDESVGTCTLRGRAITEDKFGAPQRGAVRLSVEKYIDTGKSFVYIDCDLLGWPIIIEDRDKLSIKYRAGDYWFPSRIN